MHSRGSAIWSALYSRWASAPIRRALLHDHILVLLGYMLLSIVLSWPLVGHFTTMISAGGIDPWHNVWTIWHYRRFFEGQEPLFFTHLLYYPYGVSLLTHSPGPLSGILALPFWPWGIEAAHNGTILVSLALTGYCMYLLARSFGFDRGVAVFCGVLLIAAPMCIGGHTHMNKVFLGGIPLALLAFHRAITPGKSRWWVLAVALSMLLLILHDGYQFVFAGLCIVFFTIVALWSADWAQRRWLVKQVTVTGMITLLVTGPLLGAIIFTITEANIDSDTNQESILHQPDLVQFVVPNPNGMFVHEYAAPVYAAYDIRFSVETFVALSYAALGLSLLALVKGDHRARPWFGLLGGCIIFALGPFLRLAGETQFTEYDLPIVLPYAFLTELPGLGFMRASGRFMMPGFVALAMLAGFGLMWLVQRFPRYRLALIVAAGGLVLFEYWPMAIKLQPLPESPAFYQQIGAQQDDMYGVLDLPLRTAPDESYILYAAIYQIHQITHEKGIMAGYLSRTYTTHPLFSNLVEETLFRTIEDDLLTVNYQDKEDLTPFINDLAYYGYRYVVWHYAISEWGNTRTEPLIEQLFAEQSPIYEDDQVRVYAIPDAPTEATFATNGIRQPFESMTLLRAGQNWSDPEEGWRWATSPAELHIHSPWEQPALLEITPAALHDPNTANRMGEHGQLDIQFSAAFSTTVDVAPGRTTIVPLVLPEGTTPLTLSLQAGNFRAPANSGDDRLLSFAISNINLQTLDATSLPEDIQINDDAQFSDPERVFALYGSGWHGIDPTIDSRWAHTPAQLLIYSPTSQQIELSSHLRALDIPASAWPAGAEPVVEVHTAANTTSRTDAVLDKRISYRLDLNAGWNSLSIHITPEGTVRDNPRLPVAFALDTLHIRILEE